MVSAGAGGEGGLWLALRSRSNEAPFSRSPGREANKRQAAGAEHTHAQPRRAGLTCRFAPAWRRKETLSCWEETPPSPHPKEEKQGAFPSHPLPGNRHWWGTAGRNDARASERRERKEID